MNIEEILKNESEESYREFSSKLINETKYPILGVRLPKLRKLARQIYKNNPYEYLGKKITYLEEVLLHAFVIGELKDKQEIIYHLDRLIPYIDNWSTCDSLCASLKCVKNDRLYFLEYIKGLLVGNSIFEKRIGYVLLLNYYIMDEYVDLCISSVLNNPSTDYYVYMAQAWLLSMIYVHYQEEILSILPFLNNETRRKTISKIQDSKQISNEDKQRAKAYNSVI